MAKNQAMHAVSITVRIPEWSQCWAGDMNTGLRELKFLSQEREEDYLQEAEANNPDVAWFTSFTRQMFAP